MAWYNTVLSAIGFGPEDLSTPEKREKKAWKAAGGMFYLNSRRRDYEHMRLIAETQAAKNMRKPGSQQQAWSEKYGFLKKYKYLLDQETRRAYKDAGGLPPDIDQRAKWLVINERAQFEQQYPPRNFAAFSSYSPPFIRKY